MKRSSLILLLATAVLLPIFSACAPARIGGNPELPYPPSRPPVVGDILHVPTGIFVSEEEMLAAVTDSRIVYVGETHDNPASHRQELAVLQALDRRYPGGVTLGLEMCTPAQQEALDRWSAGELTEKEFLKTSHWLEVWQSDYAYYRDLLNFARDRHIPVIGLNTDKELRHAVARKDFPELSPELSARLPEIDRDDPYHRALVTSIFGGHDGGSSRLEGFLRVQLLWDETMAENIARYLASPQGEDRHLLVVAGGNHIRNGFGIPRRVFRRLPVSYVLIGSHEIEIPPDKQDRIMDVDIPEFPLIPYDYLAYTVYEDLGKKDVKLGVLLDASDGKVRVKGVQPGSNGEKAGLKEGDTLLRFNDAVLSDNFDLVYEVQQMRPGGKATLTLERDGAEQKLEVTFAETPPPADHPKK